MYIKYHFVCLLIQGLSIWENMLIANKIKENANKIVNIYIITVCIFGHIGSFYLRKYPLKLYK